jgi:uncharacterized repeat protein (TIGR04076 family)
MKMIAKVISQQGTCPAGHKVGDEFEVGQTTSEGLCSWAFYTMFPFAETLQFGGTFPWEGGSEKAKVLCPDPDNPVIFELRKVED